ncbi:potassium channel family protein [Plantactinospora siamensis]|uniref:Potassium channel family protein n=1 Tax=Plantactinospora siamensis TaxID=555372 RepID=A0ABV6NYM2_9ACTN
MSPEPGYRRERWYALLTCLLVVLAYFVVPLRPDVSTPRLVLRGLATTAAVVVIAMLVFRQVRRQVSGAPTNALQDLLRLTVALVGGLVIFALADYVIVLSAPGQFVGLRTRVDALYFAVSTITTIGYGDVYARGQFARVFVMIQMLFSVGVVATGASILVKQFASRPRK